MKSQVEWAMATYKKILEIYDSVPNQNVKNALLIAVNKANGQLASGLHETRPIIRALAKGRKVGSQKYGDVHVGHKGDTYAKTIELKSKTDVFPGNVNKEIRKGLQRLQGVFGKKPRPGDVWVLDVLLANDLNQWPYGTNNSPRPAVSLEKLVDDVKARLATQIKAVLTEKLLNHIDSGYPDRAKEIDTLQEQWEWDLSLDTIENSFGAVHGGKSSRPVIATVHTGTGTVRETIYLNALTIKIRFSAGMPYPITPAVGTNNAVTELKFQISSQSVALSAANIDTRLLCVGKTLCKV